MEPEGVVRGVLADVICSLITISYFYLFVKFSSYDYLFSYLCAQLRLSSHFIGNETIYGIKNTHLQQNRTDQHNHCG
jgi:hypothetical protein